MGALWKNSVVLILSNYYPQLLEFFLSQFCLMSWVEHYPPMYSMNPEHAPCTSRADALPQHLCHLPGIFFSAFEP